MCEQPFAQAQHLMIQHSAAQCWPFKKRPSVRESASVSFSEKIHLFVYFLVDPIGEVGNAREYVGQRGVVGAVALVPRHHPHLNVAHEHWTTGITLKIYV